MVGLQGGNILLNVARLVPEKNQRIIILALREILQQFNDIYLVIIGDGPEKNNLLALIRKCALNNNAFIYSRKIPNKYMNEIYSDSFLYLIPSTYELFNMTMLEAMACGLPVIANNEGGMADVILNNNSGFLIDGNDYKVFAKYVCNLLRNKQKYDNLRNNSKKLSFRYDWKLFFTSYTQTDGFANRAKQHQSETKGPGKGSGRTKSLYAQLA